MDSTRGIDFDLVPKLRHSGILDEFGLQYHVEEFAKMRLDVHLRLRIPFDDYFDSSTTWLMPEEKKTDQYGYATTTTKVSASEIFAMR